MASFLWFAPLIGTMTLISAEADFAVVDAYLKQFGVVPANILDVRFGDILLHGSSSQFNRSAAPFLRSTPSITWEGTGSVIFLDLDCGGRPADDTHAGRIGPFVHSLWPDCQGSIEYCATVGVRYRPPGNTSPKPNRYTFLLIEHSSDRKLNWSLTTPGFRIGAGLDLAELLRINPAARLASYNFMLVGEPRGTAKKRHGR